MIARLIDWLIDWSIHQCRVPGNRKPHSISTTNKDRMSRRPRHSTSKGSFCPTRWFGQRCDCQQYFSYGHYRTSPGQISSSRKQRCSSCAEVGASGRWVWDLKKKLEAVDRKDVVEELNKYSSLSSGGYLKFWFFNCS